MIAMLVMYPLCIRCLLHTPCTYVLKSLLCIDGVRDVWALSHDACCMRVDLCMCDLSTGSPCMMHAFVLPL